MSQYADHQFFIDTQNNSWANLYRFVPEGARVLDVGCATGNFGEALERTKGATVVGIDLNAADIEVAQSKITEAFVMDATDGPSVAKLGQFDVIVFADVLEHVVEPRSVLSALRGNLFPDGRVVYSIPNMGHMSVRLDLLEGRFGYTETGLLDYTHLHFYDEVEVHDVFESAGFRISDEAPVLSEYPFELLRGRLARIGIDVNQRFLEVAHTTGANVYQFVGVAFDEHGEVTRERGQRTLTLPTDEILEYARYFLAENERLRNTDHNLLARKRADERAQEIQIQLDRTSAELQRVTEGLLEDRRHPIRFLAAALKQRARSAFN